MPGLFDLLNEIADIQGLITGAARESEVLEYKTASAKFIDADRAELVKDVSAMANSGGGVLVYGVATDAKDKTKPISIQSIHPTNIETFDRVVNSQIKPLIGGIRKKLIPLSAPQVMIVDIPESDNPPHQNLYDKKYYRRSGTESLPMEHDLVALYFGRKTGPILNAKFQLLSRPTEFTGDPPFSNEFRVRVLIENTGKRVGKYVEAMLLFPLADQVRVEGRSGFWDDISSLYPGLQARQFTNNVGAFHPKMAKSILEIGFSLSKAYLDSRADETFIRWMIYADEMDPQGGVVTLRELLS